MDFGVIGQFSGLIGDGLNLVGAYILAKDMLDRDREFLEKSDLEQLVSQLKEEGIPAVYDGIALSRPNAVSLTLIVKAVKRGRIGFSFIAVGFVFLIAYRILELIQLSYENRLG